MKETEIKMSCTVLRSLRRLSVLKRHITAQTTASSGSNPRPQEPSISVTPSVGMVDEKVRILIRGLNAQQKVTVVADVVENGMRFESRCVYESDSSGRIDNFKSESIDGTFKGVEPMGLFWSLKCPSAPNQSARLVKKDVETPLDFTLKVFPGICIESNASCRPILETKFQRLYKRPGVKRIPLTGKFKGVIFVPEGKGPFPGLIDLYGGLVSIIETRAALLASHGYATMALSYLHVKGVFIEGNDGTGISYTKEAYEWFSEQEYVDKNKLGAIGLCYGGQLSLALASLLPQIRAVVNINGLAVLPMSIDEWMNPNEGLPTGWPNEEKIQSTEEGVIIKNVFDCEDPDPLPAWRHGANILVIVGEDDKQINPESHKQFYDLCPLQHKDQVQIHSYPGAGHMIEPPYSPHARATIPGRKRMRATLVIPDKYLDEGIMAGGWPDMHAHAQEDSWNKILLFLDKNLKNTVKETVKKYSIDEN